MILGGLEHLGGEGQGGGGEIYFKLQELMYYWFSSLQRKDNTF